MRPPISFRAHLEWDRVLAEEVCDVGEHPWADEKVDGGGLVRGAVPHVHIRT